MSEYGNLIEDTFVGRDNAAKDQTVGTIDAEPDKAARAMHLSRATNVPPSVIYGDLENFEKQHKSMLASDIVSGNQHLTDYVTSDPMHAALSNDDYGQLDAVSQGVQKLGKRSVMGAAFDGLKEGFGEDPMGAWLTRQMTPEFIHDHRASLAVSTALTAPVEMFFRTVNAVVYGSAAAAGEATTQLSGEESQGRRMTRDLIQMANVAIPEFVRGYGVASAGAHNRALKSAIDSSMPYIKAGKEPPVGLNPVLDEVKKQQTDIDINNLNDALKEAQKSATRERNPQVFESFIAQHTDAKIGISADAIERLYGDKLPAVDDNVLGWAPKLQEQIAIARATGGDVEIPLSAWLAHVDPTIAKELRDDIRVRPGGLTKNEAKELKTPDVAPPVDAVEMIRQTAGLDPVYGAKGEASVQTFAPFGRDVKSLKLERDPSIAEKLVATFEEPGATNNYFKLVDENGRDSGFLSLTDKGKEVYVEYIQAAHDIGRLSPAIVRDILQQIKEQFPNAESIGGYRVSGARHEAGKMGEAKVALSTIDPKEVIKLTDLLNAHRKKDIWESIGDGAEVALKEEYTAKEHQLSEAVYEILQRIAPTAQAHTVSKVRYEGVEVGGLHRVSGDKSVSQILVPLAYGDAPSIARHEAIHHLYRMGFFKPEEWNALRKAVDEHGWVEKFGLDKDQTYANLKDTYKDSYGYLQEEAIAQAYEKWKLGELPPKEVGPKVQQFFEKLREFIDQMLVAIEQIIGKVPTYDELFQKIESGEIGSRKPGPAPDIVKPAPSVKEPELPGMTRMEDRLAFEQASAIGMTVDQFKRYIKLIEKRREEDAGKFIERAIKEQERRQTKEWKENEKILRQDAVEIVNSRPDYSADKFFRDGELYGERVGQKPRLNSDLLTEEQKAALPKTYYGKTGLHPDDAASLFGYPSGKAMVEHMIAFEERRKASGLRPDEYRRELIKQETDRLMEEKYGKLEQNILDQAQDQVLSQTQLDLLHEEVMALGTKAGAEFSITKDQLRSWIDDQFQNMPMSAVRTDKFLATAGKAGRAAEDFLLQEKYADAFKEKQRQYIAITMAKQAAKIEKAQASLDKTAKRFSAREIKSVDQEYNNFIQGLLIQAGYPVRRSVQEINSAIEATGYKNLESFVAEKAGDGWDIQIADWLNNGAKKLETMSTQEFLEFKDAIDSLAYVGRQAKLIDIAGEKMEFAAWRQGVIDNISTLPARPREKQGRWLYYGDAMLTRMEEIVKDLDLRQELGPLFNAVIQPMMLSKAKAFDLMQELSNHFKETRGDFGKKWQKSLNDSINQDFLIDPYSLVPYDLTRENLLQIMLNWGNDSNRMKFAQGYASLELGRKATKEEATAFAEKVTRLIHANARKEDWDFVQRMAAPFKKWQPQIDTVARNTSGVAPKWIDIQPLETPFGTLDGWYWPVKYDRLGSNLNVIEERKPSSGAVFGPDYFRAATAKSHLKERTGYIDFVDITTSIEQAAGTMQQTIHDIAYRDALIQAGKVFYDKQIRATIRKHYGMEYEAQLIPWLKRIANQYTVDEKAITFWNDWQRRLRVNLVGHALPLNLKVIFSPDVGVPNPKAWASYLSNRSENTKFAMEHSSEIRHLVYNMDRDFREQMDRTTKAGTVDGFQKKAVEWSFVPMMKVSQEFRVATFVDQFNKAKAAGRTDIEAANIADSKVREQHGAASVVDLPAIMTSNETVKSLTMFYGYFNTMYNWQRQLPGNVRRREWDKFMVNGLGSIGVGAFFGAALFNQQKEGESWWTTIGKAMVLQPLSTIPIVREAASLFFEGFPQRTPTESVLNAYRTLSTDIQRVFNKQPAKKPIQNTANVVGLTTGLPMAQVGRTGQFLYDVHTRKQMPRSFPEWWRGIVTGESKLKK